MVKVAVGNRYIIEDEDPLTHLDQAPALAFGVYRPKENQRIGYALVCDPKAPPRLDLVDFLRKMSNRGMVNVVDTDIIFWPQEGRECPIIILEIPAGSKLFRTRSSIIRPLPEDKIITHFILPVARTLEEMHLAGHSHRAIRIDNLFYEDMSNLDMLLGECISSPPGLAQTAAYETIPNCMALPVGRSRDPGCDLYALGVTILGLLLGETPMKDMPEEEILRNKLQLGSYNCLASNVRISMSMMEPLRALLSDEEEDRWSLELLIDWAEGRRQTPRQPMTPIKANRPFRFANREYYTARELAHGLYQYWEQALPMIRSNLLSRWLRQHLADGDVTERFTEAINGNYVPENADADRALSRIIVALDTLGPLRFREISASVDSLPYFIATFLKDPEARDLFDRLMATATPTYQVGFEEVSKKFPRELGKLERYRQHMLKSSLCYGLERVVYEYATDFPCLSPILEREYVLKIHHLVPALNAVAKRMNMKMDALLDNDILSFVAARAPRVSMEKEFVDLDSGLDSAYGRVLQIRLLTNLQNEFNKGELFPELTVTAAKILQPTLSRFHSAETRDLIQGRLKKAERSGQLLDLVTIVDNAFELRLDQESFLQAQNEHSETVTNLNIVHQDITNRTKIAANMGGQIAGIISSGIAVFVVTVGILIELFF